MGLLDFGGQLSDAESKNEKVPHDIVVKWADAKRALKDAEAYELQLRLSIVHTFFDPEKTEGGETREMDDGRKIAATKILNRTIDPALLQTLTPELRDQGIPLDIVIRYKPEIVIGEYRKLDEKQRMFLDQILTIKDGTPQLEMRTPKNWTPLEGDA
jgi:hypothetical protein